ncbi:unnamed protein product [Prunus armeniaca]
MERGNRMLDEGIAPDVVTYNTVIEALCKERQTEEALSVLELMSQRGMRLDIFTYNSLINGMCLTDQWAGATWLFDEMVGQGVLPNIVTLTILLDALCKGGRQKRLSKYLRQRFNIVWSLAQ